jgi:hypothetical protein
MIATTIINSTSVKPFEHRTGSNSVELGCLFPKGINFNMVFARAGRSFHSPLPVRTYLSEHYGSLCLAGENEVEVEMVGGRWLFSQVLPASSKLLS